MPPSSAKRLPLLVRLYFTHIRDAIETIEEIESWGTVGTIVNVQKRVIGAWAGICVSDLYP